jgi:hypothetical protein
MTAKDYAHARMREERTSVAMCRSLGRSLRVGASTISISITSLTDELEPRFSVTWSPAPPSRLTPATMQLLEAFRSRAMAELRAELDADRR